MSKCTPSPYNSKMYDECNYNSYLKRSEGPFRHTIFPNNYVNCGSCMVDDTVCKTDEQMNKENDNIMVKKIDIESYLIRDKKNTCEDKDTFSGEKTDPKLLPKDLCSVVPNRQPLPTFYGKFETCK